MIVRKSFKCFRSFLPKLTEHFLRLARNTRWCFDHSSLTLRFQNTTYNSSIYDAVKLPLNNTCGIPQKLDLATVLRPLSRQSRPMYVWAWSPRDVSSWVGSQKTKSLATSSRVSYAVSIQSESPSPDVEGDTRQIAIEDFVSDPILPWDIEENKFLIWQKPLSLVILISKPRGWVKI